MDLQAFALRYHVGSHDEVEKRREDQSLLMQGRVMKIDE